MEDKLHLQQETDRRQTESMDTGCKQDLIRNNHPLVRQIKEIRGILFGDPQDKLPESVISLKNLFLRENIDEMGIDSKILLKISCALMWVLEQMAENHIYMGLGDLGDIYTDPLSDYEEIYILHAEKFQILDYEQDYEWYPEDEKLLGELILFDEKSQELADCRLIYKVLTGASRGSVKIPPRLHEKDYSDMFYKKMPQDLKEFFDRPQDMSRSLLKDLLYKNYMEQSKEAESKEGVPKSRVLMSQTPSRPLYCMYIILRTDLNKSVITGRLLYDLQDAISLECQMAGYLLKECFIHGDACIHVREMKEDPIDFRVQLKNKIKSYSAGQALLIAAQYYHSLLDSPDFEKDSEKRCIIIFDGDLTNSREFQYALPYLESLKEAGVRFYLTSDQEYHGEACQKLKAFLLRQEDYYVIKNAE